MTQTLLPVISAEFNGIGYTRDRGGFPLEAVRVSVPKPAPGQVLVHVAASSLNPLEYKLAELNFFGRKPPVILGFDLAGTIVAVGDGVLDFAVGDEVVALADPDGDGGWAAGGCGGYAVASDYLTVKKPNGLRLRDAATLPICFLAAYLGLAGRVRKGDTVYIPGGGGGVGHLAIQMTARLFGAGRVISSGSKKDSIALARASGASHVFDYKQDDIAAEILKLTDGKGVDLVFDATYNERGFAGTAGMVREGGTWVVLGVGPGKTSRTAETISPVDAILAERGARHVNANMLRYYSEPSLMDAEAKAFFQQGLRNAVDWAVQGLVVPHVGRTIDSTIDELNAQLSSMKAGEGALGKVAVIVDKAAR